MFKPVDDPQTSRPIAPTPVCGQGCCHPHEHGDEHLHQHDSPSDVPPKTETIRSLHGEAQQTDIRIDQMDCPTEETLIRNRLGRMNSVGALSFNLMQRVLTVTHQPAALPEVLQAIRDLGFVPEIKSEENTSPSDAPQKTWWPLALSGVAALVAELVEWTAPGNRWIVASLALIAILSGGLPTYKKGWIALKNLNLNINALMSIAVTGAVLIGQWPEAAMVAFLFAVAEAIEARSLDRARQAISGLMQMTPETAEVRQDDGNWQTQTAKTVAIGTIVRAKPGERIALDGEVIQGHSTINQAPITGESVPIDKNPGDKVFAGTINNEGELEYRVTTSADSTTLARIIQSVETAQSRRAPTQRFVDQFSRYYTPAVVLVAFCVAVIPPLAFGGVWMDWIYRALVMLVIACPCALVVSTPVTIVSGLAAAARRGILIKGGLYLEQGKKLQELALDKTGTLTEGKPSVISWQALQGSTEDNSKLTLAAALANRSDHPISRAISAYAQQQGCVAPALENFTALAGRGTEGLLNGQRYRLGNHRLVEDSSACSPELEGKIFPLEKQGNTVVILLCETENRFTPIALFAIADTLRPQSQEAIEQLHQLGIRTVMLTGDNLHTAQTIGKKLNINDIRGELLPENKLAYIEQRVEQNVVIGMVGDGINDAPALARAHIGFAMGAAGTDTAIETADVALMDDDPRKLPEFIRLARRTSSILWQNIAIALGIKAVFMALTLMGEATLWMAVFADMGSSLIVIFNGLRLLRK